MTSRRRVYFFIIGKATDACNPDEMREQISVIRRFVSLRATVFEAIAAYLPIYAFAPMDFSNPTGLTPDQIVNLFRSMIDVDS